MVDPVKKLPSVTYLLSHLAFCKTIAPSQTTFEPPSQPKKFACASVAHALSVTLRGHRFTKEVYRKVMRTDAIVIKSPNNNSNTHGPRKCGSGGYLKIEGSAS
jgi:hypothetical protein